MVHQHFMLAGAATVLDNILLGDRRDAFLLDRRSARTRLTGLMDRLQLRVDADARVETLSVGQQQRVEILKALYRDVSLLILDEPTAMLTPQESDELLAAVRRLKGQGKAVVFISHKLAEVLSVCDDLTVLRRGKVAWQGEARAATPAELAHHMVGRGIDDLRRSGGSVGRGEVLRLDHAATGGLSPISLSLGPEILGVAGVDGNGQQELSELLVGLRRPCSGAIHLDGHDVTHENVARRADVGLAHIPNDRKREGLVPAMTLPENLALKHHRSPPFSRRGLMSWRNTRALAANLVQRFDVRAPPLDAPASSLSGGNAQKLLLARELAVIRPRLIVAMNPTRGLDLAATRAVHQELLRQRDAGCAVLLISSDLDELLALSDRLAVLYRGSLTLTRYPDETRDRIGQLMAGLP
jgi:simple sugar transport system ATP-binding protein